jgi:peptide/nickel transport system permease protein
LVAYILRRLALSVLVLFIVTLLAFMLIQLVPADPVITMLGTRATPEAIEKLRAEYWLDRPLYVQYLHWLGNVVRGDFGKSVIYREDVTQLIVTRLPVTAYLSVLALCVSALLGIPAGLICAVRRGGILDQTITALANLGVATPVFWLGILGIYLFGLELGWLPTYGYASPFDDLGASLKYAVMPVACLALEPLAIIARQTRSSMLEVTRQDYIRTAWSKGLSERVVVLRHALKNGLIPVVTLLPVELRMLIGGSVLVETVFSIPGMGRLLVRSVFDKDFFVVQAVIMMVAVLVAVANLIVDISYAWLDPRIRYD